MSRKTGRVLLVGPGHRELEAVVGQAHHAVVEVVGAARAGRTTGVGDEVEAIGFDLIGAIVGVLVHLDEVSAGRQRVFTADTIDLREVVSVASTKC